MTLAITKDPALQVVSDAAGRMRVQVAWVRCNSRRAVAVEEAVAKCNGVRVVHAYPRTGSVVVWYSPKRCDRAAVLAAIDDAGHVAADLIPARAPHSVRDPQHRRPAHGHRRGRPGSARCAPIRVRAATAARPQRPGGGQRRDHLHRVSVPARRAALTALRPGRHRCAGLGGHRGQPHPARERGRADRAVAAQHR